MRKFLLLSFGLTLCLVVPADLSSAVASSTTGKSTTAKKTVGKKIVGRKIVGKKKPARKPVGSFRNGKMTLSKYIPKNGFHKGEPVVIIVDRGSHFTYVLQKQANNRVVKVFSASNAIGKGSTQTPYGRFWITQKTKWPSWVPPKSVDPRQKAIHPYNKDRKNPLGVARLRLNKWDIALHGANNPRLIRKDVSRGCIRHSNDAILKVFNMTKVGDPVYITRSFKGTTIRQSDFK